MTMLIPTCLIKLCELILAVSCLTLHHYSYDLTDVPTLMLCSGTYVGYVVVLSGEIIGEMLFAPLDLVQDMYFGILGVGLFSISGGLMLSARLKGSLYPRAGDHSAALLTAALSILNALFMFFDVSLAYLDSEEFDEEASEAVSAAADAYVDAWWSATGSCLFACCGGLTLAWWREVPACPRRSLAQAAAICAVVNAVLLFIDALMAICSAHKEGSIITRAQNKAGNKIAS